MLICETQLIYFFLFFFFNDTATTEIYTLSLHDALPISPPRPSVAPSRKTLRGNRSISSSSITGNAGSPPVGGASAAAGAAGRVSGSCPIGVRRPPVTSRIQRNALTTAITAPATAAGQLTIKPTRTHAIPIAKPIGQRLGPGTCG